VSAPFSSSSANILRNDNKRALLDLIRFTPGGISRAELARQQGLSRSAVTAIVNEILEGGLVRETESIQVSTGRRPIMLEINPSRGCVLGVDMGATHLALLLADLNARVLAEIETPFDIRQGPHACIDQLDSQVQALVTHVGFTLKDILTVGIGVPGPIGDGITVIAPPIMPGWDSYPIQAELVARWGCPVSLHNDAELGALGEWAYGAGRDERNVVFIKVGSGVGAGLILNDFIYRGQTGTAGEIGHITIQQNGPLCTCGNKGCLEALAGGRAIAGQAQAAVRSGQRTLLGSITPVEGITAKDVTQAARRGDLVSQQIVSTAGAHLGTAIAGLINTLNPGIVVVGGGVAQAGDLLLEPLRRTVRERSLIAASQAVRITTAVLGRRSTSMGAVVQAVSMVLDHLAGSPPAPVPAASPASRSSAPPVPARQELT
jgi:glucokinase-like ROK family protein